jgi:hypothetical protein
MSRVRVLLTAVVLAVTATTGWAQDSGRIGLVANTAESVGAIWHLSEKVAVRAGIDFSHVSTEPDFPDDFLGLGIERSYNSVGLNLSALLFLGQWDDLEAYVSPGYGQVWNSSGNEYIERSQHQVEGLFGLQYALGSRFRVFGEAGVRYVRSRTEQDIFGVLGGPAEDFGDGTVGSTVDAIGSGSRFGIIFYFK